MRSALKDTTQRYKSLAGFAIYAIVCDISSMRYAFAFLAIGEICQKREGDLYHIATDRKGGYIAFERSLHGKPRKYIAFAKANISP